MRRREFRLARTALCIAAAMLMVVAANRNDVVQAQRLETVSVVIRSNGAEQAVSTAQSTVEATLKEAGVKVGPLDVVKPSTNERPRDGMRITVVQVREAIETVTAPIAFETVKTFTHALRPGQLKITTPGVRGEKVVRYLVRCEDDKPVAKKLLGAEVTRQPVKQVVSIGSRGRYTSRGEFRSRRIIKMKATAYDPGPRSCGKYATGRTACGLRAGYGVVAVDTKVIPMGSKLYIEGYGHAIAGDRGRAIRGNRIDLGFDTYRAAMNFGRRTVIVHILE